MASRIITRKIDLRNIGGARVASIRGIRGEAKADTWRVTLMDGEAAANMTGWAAYAQIIRHDGTLHVVGTIIGNTVEVTFPQAAYAYAGVYNALLWIVNASTETEIAIDGAQFMVESGASGETIDPGTAITTTLAGLLASEAARVSAETGRASAEATRAAFYAGFNSQLADIDNLAPHHTYAVTWELGSITNSGATIPNPTTTGNYNIRTNEYIPINGHKNVAFDLPADFTVYVVCFFASASQGSFLSTSTSGDAAGRVILDVPASANYFKLSMGKKAEITLAPYIMTKVYEDTRLLAEYADIKAITTANTAAIADNAEAIEGILGSMVVKDTMKTDFAVTWELGYMTSDGSTVNNPNSNGYYYMRMNAYKALGGAANVSFDMPYGLITYAVYFFGIAAKASLISVITYAGPPRKAVVEVPDGANYFKVMIGTNASIVLADYSATKVYESTYNGDAMVSIIDDDGVLASAESWERISDAVGGIPVTMALITSHIGDVYGGNQQVTWADVRRLKAKGFEFISHSHGHVDLTTLSEAGLEADFDAAQQALDDHGCTPGFLAYPFNANNTTVQGVAMKYFQGAFKGSNLVNELPIKPFELTRVNLFNLAGDAMLSLSAMKSWVNSAIAKKGWLVFMAHNYYPFVDTEAETRMIQMLQYAKGNGVKIVSVSEGFRHFNGLS